MFYVACFLLLIILLGIVGYILAQIGQLRIHQKIIDTILVNLEMNLSRIDNTLGMVDDNISYVNDLIREYKGNFNNRKKEED